MDKTEQLEQEILRIKERNKKVEADKAWETSLFRKLLIAVLTYVIIVIFFFADRLPKPFINAIVPTIGFILSTISIPVFKKFWVKKYSRKIIVNINK